MHLPCQTGAATEKNTEIAVSPVLERHFSLRRHHKPLLGGGANRPTCLERFAPPLVRIAPEHPLEGGKSGANRSTPLVRIAPGRCCTLMGRSGGAQADEPSHGGDVGGSPGRRAELSRRTSGASGTGLGAAQRPRRSRGASGPPNPVPFSLGRGYRGRGSRAKDSTLRMTCPAIRLGRRSICSAASTVKATSYSTASAPPASSSR